MTIHAVAAVLALSTFAVSAPTTVPTRPQPIDVTTNKTLYVVGYAHLDTQWRWTYPQVIREYIPATLHRNFELFDKYPGYIFNFSGSRRYEMMREYYPQDFEKLRKYIADGRWFPCGSSVDENDSLVPSAESIVRHVLYGNRFFQREFGTQSQEYMLPDCFGFPGSLPSILSHCGIRGFSTQKLTWGSAAGIPFKVGVWEGVDGRSVIAALDPGSYGGTVNEDLSQSESWLARINNTGDKSGAYVDYHYYGTGDTGGSPQEEGVKWLQKSAAGAGAVKVVSATAEQMFLDIKDQQRAKLPTYKGELLLTQHSCGAISSQAYMKRWNRKNELLADAAERACVAAAWLGMRAYPAEKLYNAWTLVLGSQMHDMLPGTSVPKAYEYCWNDELLAANQFSTTLTDAVAALASQMDTQSAGVPLVVYNPLSQRRQDVVEATVSFRGNAPPQDVTVVGPDGKAAASQILSRTGNDLTIAFIADVPSVGCATYDVRPAGNLAAQNTLRGDEKSIESPRFRVTIDDSGDITSIFDKEINREALSAPIRLAFLYENPSAFPAWNMDWSDRKQPPRSYVTGPAQVRVTESGPVRATLEVTRHAEGSRFIQRISVCAGGADDRVTVSNIIDWQTQERSLKSTFPMAVANRIATYDIGLGVMQRGNNDPKKYEVPQHQWFDLTDPAGEFGVAVLNDCKYGSDKPDDQTLRLTMLYTPGVRGGYRDQATQDIGRHEIVYAVAPHAGDWRRGGVAHIASRVNQPLRAFIAPPHAGPLGKSFSLFNVDNDHVAIVAIKKAEDNDDIVVRVRELSGIEQEVRIASAAPIVSAREGNGQERDLAAARIEGGAVVTSVHGFGLKSFALKLGPPSALATATPQQSQPLPLTFDLDVVSLAANRSDGAFDADGRTIAGDQLPSRLVSDGIEFALGSTADGQRNALACRGQTISLPRGIDRVYVLAAAVDGDQPGKFIIGQRPVDETIQDWGGYIGQWDNRLWEGEVDENSHACNNPWAGLTPGFVKPDEVAWFCSHRHHQSRGNEFYRYGYIFKYSFEVPGGASTMTLPNNDKIRIFAITAASNSPGSIRAAAPLFDTLDHHVPEPRPEILLPPSANLSDMVEVKLGHALYWRSIKAGPAGAIAGKSVGGLRYTTDGSAPNADSPAYTKPLLLWKKTTIRACEFDPSGHAGAEATATVDVNDTTPPAVQSVGAVGSVPSVTIKFSEPVNKSSAEAISNYRFDPPADVRSVNVADDQRSVTLMLAKPLDAARASRLTVNGVSDLSPSSNQIALDAHDVAVASPLFTLASYECKGESLERRIEGLPTRADQPWSINFFVKTGKQPDNRTIIAGFGRTDDQSDGAGRYICKFGGGVHFWSRLRDVTTRTRLDLNEWQMLSATYDGTTLRVYKDAEEIGAGEVALGEDEPIVRVAPVDPWDQKRRFSGEIRSLTIWNLALPPEVIELLRTSRTAETAAGKSQ